MPSCWAERPLGPARFEFVTGEDFCTAALEGRPDRTRGLVNFGANLVIAHGDSARGRDALAAGDWVRLATPYGSVRTRAKLNTNRDPQVVFGQHGWWQACSEIDLPGHSPHGPESANLNLVLRQQPSDLVSDSSPLRASVCEVEPLIGPV